VEESIWSKDRPASFRRFEEKIFKICSQFRFLSQQLEGFISKALDKWAYENGVTLDFSRPGKPADSAFIEAFNSWFRREYLNQHWLLDLEDARAKSETWRHDYISFRPHGATGDLQQRGQVQIL
jgi:transposase InsO family protein